jgi:hypothetical protein
MGLIMHGIIGNLPSANFILFANDDQTPEPDIQEIKRLLSTKKVFLFKRSGHYRHTINSLDYLISCKGTGILNNEYSSGLCITNIVRVDAGCKRNEFFDLKYSGQVIAYLTLDNSKLTEIELLIKKIRSMQSEMIDLRSNYAYLDRAVMLFSKNKRFKSVKTDPILNKINLIIEDTIIKQLSEIKLAIDDCYEKIYWY